MFRKLMIKWRSFVIKYIRNERCKKPMSYFNNFVFDWMFKYGGYEMLKRQYNKRKQTQITYYKNGKEYKRTFEDKND